jgi:hypothetical protein
VVERTSGGLRDTLVVKRADPRVRIGADLLQEISVMTERNEDRWTSLVDDVLTIRADNRTVVYRVDFTDYDAADDTYGAEWPD